MSELDDARSPEYDRIKQSIEFNKLMIKDLYGDNILLDRELKRYCGCIPSKFDGHREPDGFGWGSVSAEQFCDYHRPTLMN